MTQQPTVEAPLRRVGIALALTAVVFGALDAVWLTLGSGDLYARMIGQLLAEMVDPVAAGDARAIP